MATKTTRCFCQNFEFGEFDGENESAVSYDTNCSQTTTKTFAQGHDAKLAGYLVRAELAGEEIRLIDGGMAVSGDAIGMAGRVSEAFQIKVVAMLDAAKARLARKAAREATKTARKSRKAAMEELVERQVKHEMAQQPVWRSAKIKVGRWTYDAQIEVATGDATYTTKLGGNKMVEQGQYKEV